MGLTAPHVQPLTPSQVLFPKRALRVRDHRGRLPQEEARANAHALDFGEVPGQMGQFWGVCSLANGSVVVIGTGRL